MDRTLLAELAHRFLSGTATEEEKALLHQWFDTTDREEIELVFLSQKETEAEVKARMLTRLQTAIAEEPAEEPRRIIGLWRWVAAASVLAVVGITGIFYWKAHKTPASVFSAAPVAEAQKELQPGGNKATLLLGDGSVVNLGAVQNGVIRKVAGAIIGKHDGQLVYQAVTKEIAGQTAAEMNTIRTPRGGQYEVVLPDGTKVWLDAASALSYPTAFTGGSRQVQLKGEAYFEVAENKNRPFQVLVGDMKIDVLGTHFNVMAYDDESAIKTTLLEGAVKVTMGQASRLLQPGEQASLERSTGVMKILNVDVDETVAWKNGVFELGGAQIEAVMRQMSRWYDVDVEYQGTTDQHFRGSIPRSANASEVFRMLELTGAVHFTVEGKKVIVRP